LQRSKSHTTFVKKRPLLQRGVEKRFKFGKVVLRKALFKKTLYLKQDPAAA
jgi:hypothetical protein